MNKIEISVIVPVYNIEKWLPRCINSLLQQTFKNFELLLINDGSTDNSLKICKDFSIKDNRIKIINKKNGGLSDARNVGLDHMQGEYVAFVDGDDFVEKNFLKDLLMSLKKYKSEVAMCSYKLVDDGNKILLKNLNCNSKVISGRDLLSRTFNHNYGVAYTVIWNKLFKKSLFHYLRFDKGRLYEDEFINNKLYWNVKKVSIVDEALYDYVKRRGSITNSEISIKKIKDADLAFRNKINFYYSKDFSLYEKANLAYQDWIFGIFENYSFFIKKSGLIKYLQRQFRASVYKVHSHQIKMALKEILGCVNLNIIGKQIYFLRKYKLIS